MKVFCRDTSEMSVIWDDILKKLNNKSIINQSKASIEVLKSISKLTLNEFSKRNLAVLIYSRIMDNNIWFCSNDFMVSQIKGDDPEAIVYTASKLIELCNINPKEDLVKAIHYSKTVFQGSKLTKNKFQ